MKILALDTSTSYLSLAISEDNKVLTDINKNLKRMDHAKFLIPELGKLLKNVKLKLDDMDALCVGLGPGSFTGLRVGLSSVKGLSIATNKKILGISSMDAVACNIDNEDKIIAYIQDARKQKVYGCLYKKEDDRLLRLTDYLLLEFEEFCKLVKKQVKKHNKDVIFTADGVGVFKDDILAVIPDALFTKQVKWHPYARNLAKLSYKIIKEEKKPFSLIDEIEPLYLHSKYANITKPKKL